MMSFKSLSNEDFMSSYIYVYLIYIYIHMYVYVYIHTLVHVLKCMLHKEQYSVNTGNGM